MKHTVVRQPAIKPPVDKIILEFTTVQFIALFRAVAHAPANAHTEPSTFEAGLMMVPETIDIFNALREVGREADLTT